MMDPGLMASLALLVALLGTAAMMIASARTSGSVPDLERHLKGRSFTSGGRFVHEGTFESVEEGMVSAMTSSGPWRMGGAFTGVALLVTFTLIGWVLSQKLGRTIGAEQIDNTLLAEAVDQMGSKFFISAVGVGCSLVHAVVAFSVRSTVRRRVFAYLGGLRETGRLVTTAEAAAEEQRLHQAKMASTLDKQLEVLNEVATIHQQSWKVALAGSAEVRESVMSIDASLQGGLAPLVDNVSKLAENLLSERAEELLARLDRSFQEGLKAGLVDVISPLKDLRQDIQKVSPEQALRDIAQQLQGAITGGASQSTESFREALEELGRALPSILAEMQAASAASQRASAEAMAGFQHQLGEQSLKSREANDRLLESLSVVLRRVDESSSHMNDVVGGIRNDASGVAATLNMEREAIGRLLAEVRASAEQIRATNASSEQLTSQTRQVATALSLATEELREKAVAEREALGLADERIRVIREGREELENAFRRVGQSVADLLARDLAALRKQSDGAAASMDQLIQKVDTNIIAGLTTQIEDLSSAVSSLERVVRNLEGRTR